ncbi:MAG TPA: hypothetical protein VMZ50_02460 [Phycisphaerae bacterium]|nr:hypothetical protein [Phycisphaerae bacterium]
MAALTDVTSLRNRGKPSQIAYVVANGVTVYPGSLVAVNAAGFLVPYAHVAGTRTVGIMNDGDAKTGDAGGTVLASVDVAGALVEQVTVTGATGIADVNSEVYGLTDNLNDLKLAQAATQGAVGMITRYYSGTLCDVWIYQASQIVTDA